MKRVTVVIFTLLLVSACAKKPETSQPPPVVAGVKIETVQASLFDDYYDAVGTVRARNSSVIAAQIMGNIVAIRVREGDTVRAGQVIVEIENSSAGIQLRKTQAGVREAQNSLEEVERSIRAAESARAAARANETLARSTLNRYRTLFERRSVSPQEFDEVVAKHEVAKAESERAERMLQVVKTRQSQVQARIEQAKADVASAQVYAGYARISSPIDGVVVSKHADVGHMAMPGTPLLTIESGSRYQLEASVEESRLGKIQLRDQARVIVDALGDQELSGTVQEIVPAADPGSRSYIVKIDLPNIAGTQLRSGLYGKARFAGGQRTVLAIPQAAITQQGQLTAVFVVDNSGIARLRFVKMGSRFGDRVEVLAGLNDGEQIVTEPVGPLKEGTYVGQLSHNVDGIAVR